ncbi:MAG: GNAT family N-acetyltransferase, partial [Bdellovibrionales bacterium]|nr:GNAT family N-acetyltransferase [Bdellovibrionales bacterium]
RKCQEPDDSLMIGSWALVALIHLILIEDRFQKHGLGRTAYIAFESLLQRYGVQRITLGVNPTDRAVSYWEKMGYTSNGKFGIERGLTKRYRVLQMEKKIPCLYPPSN